MNVHAKHLINRIRCKITATKLQKAGEQMAYFQMLAPNNVGVAKVKNYCAKWYGKNRVRYRKWMLGTQIRM